MIRRIAACLLLLITACVVPARAQFGSIAPPFAKLTGGFLWGSLGYRDMQHPERFAPGDPHPFARAGFAALLGPFGGQPDTTVTLDSVRTTAEWMPGKPSVAGAVRVDTMRTVHAVRSHYSLPGRDGWVSLAVGYQYISAFRVAIDSKEGALTSTFPVGGVYCNAMFGPFALRHVSKRAFWYVALGAGAVQLTDANGRSDGTLVRFDTERAMAPEAMLLLGWRAHRGVRVIGGVSAQRIRWSSIRYRSPFELPLPDGVMQRLPDGLRITTVHVLLGLSFDASDLFGR